MNAAKNIKFRLPQSFVSKYAGKDPAFGFNGLGELVFYRTYSRVMLGGHKEQWFQTVERVVNGTFNMQKGWLLSQSIPWNEDVALNDACEMYDRIFTFKFLPPGRGLWAMGTSLIEERKMFAALNNCAFVSTADITNDPAAPFCFLMDASMLGVGVGFDTKGAGKIEIIPPAQQSLAHEEEVFSIEDSREGWVNALRSLIEAYTLCGKPLPKFDFSKIRQEGAAIRTFGGTSQGPGPLRQLLADAGTLLASLVGRRLTVTAIVDLMNFIGRCVIAGNVRRTAEIAFGSPDDQEYIELKNYKVNSHRESYAWVSNNSVFASLGMEYSEVTKHCRVNGEPGFAWLENMQAYGRMVDHPNFKDANATGGNPCLEQTLESYEMCCLVETFPEKHESIEDYLRTLDLAFLYAKTVTLGPTKWEQTNSIMTRNRRIGTSMSGIAQFIAKWGLNTLKEWCEKGYERVQEQDHKISAYFNINRSVKTTSVKPSGTVSLLAGATPGVHFPEARFYLRRVRLAADSDLLPALSRAGYRVEPSVTDPDTTVVVEVPVDAGSGVRTLQEVSMWEQLALAAFLQKYWADNQVSCTVTFDPETEGSQLEHALDFYQYQLKGVSFLPKLDCGAFPQMPYEKISERRYYELTNQISLGVSLFHGKLSPMICGSTISRKDESNDDYCPELFCDSDKCTVDSGGSNISSRRSMDTTQPPVVVVQQQKEKQQKRMKAAVAKINNGSDDDASSNNKENKPPAAAEREFGVFPLSPVIDMVSECTTTINYHKSQMMLLNSNEKKKSFHFLEL